MRTLTLTFREARHLDRLWQLTDAADVVTETDAGGVTLAYSDESLDIIREWVDDTIDPLRTDRAPMPMRTLAAKLAALLAE